MPLLFVIQQMMLLCTACPVPALGAATIVPRLARPNQAPTLLPHVSIGVLHGHQAAAMTQGQKGTRARPEAAFVSGHGNRPSDKLSNMPLFFVIQQVSEGDCMCFKSDNRCIIVLPCPRVFFACALQCRDNLFLLLSGDVELNPGPDTTLEKMIKQVLENQKQMSSEIKEVKENQVTSQQRQDEMAAKITRLETALDALQKSNRDIVQLRGTVQKLEELVHIQQTKITDLEDRSGSRSYRCVKCVKQPDPPAGLAACANGTGDTPTEKSASCPELASTAGGSVSPNVVMQMQNMAAEKAALTFEVQQLRAEDVTLRVQIRDLRECVVGQTEFPPLRCSGQPAPPAQSFACVTTTRPGFLNEDAGSQYSTTRPLHKIHQP
ncbi:uncharacterized protein LOC120849103 [Ixodes scapularis]|uniref:uncharacterized protein LOC120849103 n=1 Tax=Ixodes scapularis TaxID=6945 RepID=UPI001A9D3065|nr:uncharacterized protein LOC120849103 [Ixodes scapularis]